MKCVIEEVKKGERGEGGIKIVRREGVCIDSRAWKGEQHKAKGNERK